MCTIPEAKNPSPRTEEQIKRNPYWHEEVKPHAIDFDEIRILVLESLHVVLASHHVISLEDSDEKGELKGNAVLSPLIKLHHERAEAILSKNLLKLSIYMRTLDDLIGAEPEYIKARDIVSEGPGIKFDGMGDLNFRDCCNKIIHAEDVRFVYESNDEEGDDERWYLEGTLELVGSYGKESWSVAIYIISFLESILNIISLPLLQ